jgi:hypothetical protein
MSTPKFEKFYQLMEEQNQALFDQFQVVHDQFLADKSNEENFHQVGRDVLDVIRDWERRLCSGMERGQFAGYSSKLSEKFWSKVKERFSLIEEVGLKTSK